MTDNINSTECPPAGDLERLIHGRCTDARTSALCDHVGNCPACQKRLDAISGSASGLAEHLREASAEIPVADSSYWKALANAEEELRRTTVFRANGMTDTPVPRDEPNLDFLQPPDKPGQLGKLAQFDVIRIVGRGGMGVVLHAYDPSLDRDVAIKVIDPQLAHNEVARQRFCREARAAAAVTHDNLVAVHQVNEDEPSGLPYLVMQLINGESLEQRIRRAGKMTAGEVARLGMQAAAGLAAAHSGGLIHRDIKPANIVLQNETGTVKIADFGLARNASDAGNLSQTGALVGTPYFMSPEQIQGQPASTASDLYSLGGVLYSLCTGEPPFPGTSLVAVLYAACSTNPTPIRERRPDLPVWLEAVVMRLLEKNPALRFPSAAAVVAALSDNGR